MYNIYLTALYFNKAVKVLKYKTSIRQRGVRVQKSVIIRVVQVQKGVRKKECEHREYAYLY